MITVDQYRYIRTAHRVYGKKIREIARETGHSRNTVKKALREEYCGYSIREKQPYPVLCPYLAIIDSRLTGDKDKPKKQRHTAKRIYDRLRHEHGFQVRESGEEICQWCQEADKYATVIIDKNHYSVYLEAFDGEKSPLYLQTTRQSFQTFANDLFGR